MPLRAPSISHLDYHINHLIDLGVNIGVGWGNNSSNIDSFISLPFTKHLILEYLKSLQCSSGPSPISCTEPLSPPFHAPYPSAPSSEPACPGHPSTSYFFSESPRVPLSVSSQPRHCLLFQTLTISSRSLTPSPPSFKPPLATGVTYPIQLVLPTESQSSGVERYRS